MGKSRNGAIVITFILLSILCVFLLLNISNFDAKAEKTNEEVTETIGWFSVTTPKDMIVSVWTIVPLNFKITLIVSNETAIMNSAYYQVFNSNDVEIYNETGYCWVPEPSIPAWKYKNGFNDYTMTGEESYYTITVNASTRAEPDKFVYFTTSRHNITFTGLTANVAPTIISTEPASYDLRLNVGDNKSFVVNATDQNNDTLHYYWELDGINHTVNASQNYYILHVNEIMWGFLHNLKVRVNDSKSESEKSWTIRVIDPSSPFQIYLSGSSIEINEISPELLGTAIDVEVIDQSGHAVSGHGSTSCANGMSIALDFGQHKSGEYIISVTLNDSVQKSIKTGVADPLVLSRNKEMVKIGEIVEIIANTRNLTGNLNFKLLGFTGNISQGITNFTNVVENVIIPIQPNNITTYTWNTTQTPPDGYIVEVRFNDTIYRATSPIMVYPLLPPIEKIEYSPLNITKGDSVSFTIVLNNTWKFQRPVGLRFIVDGSVVKSVHLHPMLEPNSITYITFNWTATEGNHTFGMEIFEVIGVTGGAGQEAIETNRYTLGIVNNTVGVYLQDVINRTGQNLTIPVGTEPTTPAINHLPVFLQIISTFRINTTTNFTYQVLAADSDSDLITYKLNTTLLSIDATGYINGLIQIPGIYKIKIILNDTKEENFTEFTLIVEEAISPLPITTQEDKTLIQLQFAIAGIIAVCITSTTLFIVFTEIGMFGFLSIFMPLFVKLKKEKVLDHFLRGQIYGLIRENPGAHYNHIKHKLELGNHELAHHLYTLEREGFITSKQDGIKKRFYPTDTTILPKGDSVENKPPTDKEKSEFGIMFSSLQEKILQAIKDKPGISQIEIATKTNLSKQSVNYNIKRLYERGMIFIKDEGWGKRHMGCYLNGFDLKKTS
ncbi:MAG: winged helix-turn-helix transcriptional regulator [Thermoplasmata archaeon]